MLGAAGVHVQTTVEEEKHSELVNVQGQDVMREKLNHVKAQTAVSLIINNNEIYCYLMFFTLHNQVPLKPSGHNFRNMKIKRLSSEEHVHYYQNDCVPLGHNCD